MKRHLERQSRNTLRRDQLSRVARRKKFVLRKLGLLHAFKKISNSTRLPISRELSFSRRKDTASINIEKICRSIVICIRTNEISYQKTEPSVIRKFHYPDSFVFVSFRINQALTVFNYIRYVWRRELPNDKYGDANIIFHCLSVLAGWRWIWVGVTWSLTMILSY